MSSVVWALATGWCIVALLSFELICRLVVRLVGDSVYLPYEWSSVRPVPAIASEGVSERVTFRRNRYGERDCLPACSSESAVDVLFFGSSFTACDFLSSGADWPSRAIAYANEMRKNTAAPLLRGQVLAASGLRSQDLERIVSTHVARRPPPSIAVVCIGVSDVVHWAQFGLESIEWPAARPRHLLFSASAEGLSWSLRGLAARRVARYVRQLYPLRPTTKGGLVLKERLAYQRARLVSPLDDPVGVHELFETQLRSIVSHLRSWGVARILLLESPWKRFVASDQQGRAQRWLGVSRVGVRKELVRMSPRRLQRRVLALGPVIASVATHLDVEFLSLNTDEVWAATHAFYDDGHVTLDGARLVGVRVGQELALSRTLFADASSTASPE